MIDNHMPMFTNETLCADKGYDADWWHPKELAGRGRMWSKTPEANLARSICGACPAKQECLTYALKYCNLTGIWGGTDRLERHAMQVTLNIIPINWTDTFESAVYSIPHDGRSNEQR
jgi:hypothetical protein